MSSSDRSSGKSGGSPQWRDVPIDWEALEDAFENNAPEVHSYLHVPTGDVLRIVDGIADPQMHARIAADANYLRIEPVSSREQYRWMERYIPMVENRELQARLVRAIDGKGAFRRFKDVLMGYGPERERWFAFRSERLRIFMEAWLNAHALNPVKRPVWVPDLVDGEEGEAAPEEAPAPAPAAAPSGAGRRPARSSDAQRRQLREIADALGARELDTLVAFAEFLRTRRAASPRSSQADAGAAPAAGAAPPSTPEATTSGKGSKGPKKASGETPKEGGEEPSSSKPSSSKVPAKRAASS